MANTALVIGGGGGATEIIVTQAGHGFTVGKWLYLVGDVYTLADNTSVVTAEVVGAVSATDGDDFTLQLAGELSGLAGRVAGTVYFLGLNGDLTDIQPTLLTEVIKPLLVANSTTSGIMKDYRGDLIGDALVPVVSANLNLMINSDFAVGQLGFSFNNATTPTNNDDTYLLDQWILLSDGNDVADVSQELVFTPDGVGSAVKLEVATANNKFGFLQVLENKRSVAAIGETVSVSFDAAMDAANVTLNKLRAAVISWDGAADAVTSDVVAVWGAEGVDPTLVANWTYENAPINLALTNIYKTFTIENIPVDTLGAENVALFIWVDNADATLTDIVFLSKVKLEISSTSTAYEFQTFDDKLQDCQRFLWKTFPYLTVPQQAVGSFVGAISYHIHNSGINADGIQTDYPSIMRTAPAVTLYNPISANTTWRNGSITADSGASSAFLIGDRSLGVTTNQVGGDGTGQVLYIHALSDARL